MLAAWYDEPGPSSVLRVGELPDPHPGPGEVRIRLTRSGVNPGDVAKREDRCGAGMPFPRVIPHSDGAGRIDELGDGVPASRLGEAVWVHGAQTGRPFGTAAQFTVVPTAQALPAAPSDPDLGACLGVPGITAHRAVLGDGPVVGSTVLVQGVRGAVGSLAAQIAARSGARVIGTVRAGAAPDPRWPGVVLGDGAAEAIRALAPDGVDRVIEVAFSANLALDLAVGHDGTVVAAYDSAEARPAIPFWPLAAGNRLVRFVGSAAFPAEVNRRAALDLTTWAAEGVLNPRIGHVLELERIGEAQDLVASGSAGGRVLLAIP